MEARSKAILIACLCVASASSQGPGRGRGRGGAAAKIPTADSGYWQNLYIPPLLEGRSATLTLAPSTKAFFPGAATRTCGFNGEPFWGPTLVFNQGDTVRIDVHNHLNEPSTVHWHGFHLPASMDGGPHQTIAPGGEWKPSFTVMNNAGTYWYHPHPHETTQKQLTSGAGGLIIIRDPIESALPLPRTYGVDDIPLVLTSRRFLTENQLSFEGDNDKYGDFPLTNGGFNARATLPAQFVRLRVLNAEIERGYNLGFSDHRKFWLIATDGGLIEKPLPLTRIRLMVGERAELLVDLSGDRSGASLDLMAFNSGQAFGWPGQEPGTERPNGSYLNNRDFRLLRIEVGARTAKPILSMPETLTKNRYWTESDVDKRRTIRITGGGRGGGEFAFDGAGYNMLATDRIQLVKLGAVEAWRIVNNQVFGHSFHMHDVQFNIVSRSDGPVADFEQGWKDTVYVPRDQSVTVVARFEDFTSEKDAYMYHCHMANHEDGGLMAEFMVVKDPATAVPSPPAMSPHSMHSPH